MITQESSVKQPLLQKDIQQLMNELSTTWNIPDAVVDNNFDETQTSLTSPPISWQQRQANIYERWKTERQIILENYVCRQPLEEGRLCDICESALEKLAIRCMSCKMHLCAVCDMNIHLKNCLHLRQLVGPSSKKFMKAHEFYDAKWNFLNKINGR